MNSVPPPLPSSLPDSPLTATSPGERLQSLDVIRGFALLGILVVNMMAYGWPLYASFKGYAEDLPLIDRLAAGLIHGLAQGKFYSLFSFLFGLGVYIQWSRAKARGRSYRWLLLRRMAALLVIGLLHAFLVWEGDVLIFYSVLGVLLLPFLNRKPGTVLVWAGIGLVIPMLVVGAIWGITEIAAYFPAGAERIEEAYMEQEAEFEEESAASIRAFSEGDFGEIMRERASNVFYVWILSFFFLPNIFAMFLLGLYAGKWGLVERGLGNARLLGRIALAGLVIGLPGNLMNVYYMDQHSPLRAEGIAVWHGVLFGVGAAAWAVAYFAGLARWHALTGFGRVLAPVGRMALTNYLLQSVVCTTVFYSYGFGLYGTMRVHQGLVWAAVLFVGQVIFSHWWFRHFEHGPVEWLWRTLTYVRMPPGTGTHEGMKG